MEWSKCAALWAREFDKRGLQREGLAYRICQDLEARLGIAQSKVAPPDYRDYLADLSLDALVKLLHALGAALVVQPEDALKAKSR